MAKATRVLSTPRRAASKSNPPDQPTTRDDELGMAWWNSLSKQERAKWSAIAGNTGRPKDAWEAFRRGSVDQTPPVDPTRRHLLTVATAGAVAGLIPTAVLAAVPAADPAFALIAEKLAADVAHCEAIDVQDKADVEHGSDSQAAWEANDRCEVAGHAVNVVDWRLARTPPTTLAGVAAVLRFANEIEDGGMEWPQTDTIGREGWHYQLRATMAAAIEALLNAQGGKAVRS